MDMGIGMGMGMHAHGGYARARVYGCMELGSSGISMHVYPIQHHMFHPQQVLSSTLHKIFSVKWYFMSPW
jgi:hypothetical protein